MRHYAASCVGGFLSIFYFTWGIAVLGHSVD